MKNKQASKEVLMIQPCRFNYNEQTALNNPYQHQDQRPNQEIQARALEEFQAFAQALKDQGLTVHIFQDTDLIPTPDSIFPNNWFSTHAGGHLAVYPMFAKNRQAEVDKFLPALEALLLQDLPADSIYRKTDYRNNLEKGLCLEGTGSMVLDRVNKIAYCALSPRSHLDLFETFCRDFGYEPMAFQAYQHHHPIYHTNILMTVTSNQALICLDAIAEEDRGRIRSKLEETGHTLIPLSFNQIDACAGNSLELLGKDDQSFQVFSKAAYNALLPEQIQQIEKTQPILVADIPTIEFYGGGSVRCMLAEIFR